MSQPRMKRKYWYAIPHKGRGRLSVTKRHPVAEWHDYAIAEDLRSVAWYAWERRQQRHANMMHGKHTQRARRAK